MISLKRVMGIMGVVGSISTMVSALEKDKSANVETATGTAKPSNHSPEMDAPQVIIGIEQGARWLWAEYQPETNQSSIFVQRLNALGQKEGAVKIIRKTSGRVLELKASSRNNRVWVAWDSELSESETEGSQFLLAAIQLGFDGVMIGKPIEIDRILSADASVHFQLIATQDGGALVVATATREICKMKIDEETQEDWCDHFNLFRIEADGRFRRLGHRELMGGNGGIVGLLDLEGVAFTNVYSYRGGPIFGNIMVPYQKEAKLSTFSFDNCLLPMEQYFTGHELVTLCKNDDWNAKKRGKCPIPGKETSTCQTIQISYADGTKVPAKTSKFSGQPLVSIKPVCKEGHPIEELTYIDEDKHNKTVDLDLTQPGSSINELFIWTGQRVLKRVDSMGKLSALRCNEDGKLSPSAP